MPSEGPTRCGHFPRSATGMRQPPPNATQPTATQSIATQSAATLVADLAQALSEMQPQQKAQAELAAFNAQVTTVKIPAAELSRLKQESKPTTTGSNPYGGVPEGDRQTWTLTTLKYITNTLVEQGACQAVGPPAQQPYQTVQKMSFTNPPWCPAGTRGKLSIQTASAANALSSPLFHIRCGSRYELMKLVESDAIALDPVGWKCPPEKPGAAPQPTTKTEPATAQPTAPTEPSDDDKLELTLRIDVSGVPHFQCTVKTWQEWTTEGDALLTAKQLASHFLHEKLGKTWPMDDLKLSTTGGGTIQTVNDFIIACTGGRTIMVHPPGPGGGRGRGRGGRGGTKAPSSHNSSTASTSHPQQHRMHNAVAQAVANQLGAMVYVNCPVTIDVMHNQLQLWRAIKDKTPAQRLAHGAVQVRCLLQQIHDEAEIEEGNDGSARRKDALATMKETLEFILKEDTTIQLGTSTNAVQNLPLNISFSLENAVRAIFPQGSPPSEEAPRTNRSYKLTVRQGNAGALLMDLLTKLDWHTAFARKHVDPPHPLFEVRHLA